MFFISLGVIDKKLLLLVISIVINTTNLIINNKLPEEYWEGTLSSLMEEIGSIVGGIILIFTLKQKQKVTKDDKKSFKYIFILFLLRFGRSCYELVFPYIVTDSSYRFLNILNTTNAIEINLTTLGTFLLLKYKYYIHHMISLIIFFILGITNEFIMKSYFIIKYNYFYVYIYSVVIEVSVFCYLKFMMDKLYYQYMEVLFYWGLTGLIEKLIILTGKLIYEHKNNIDGIIYDINVYFAETSVLAIIFIQFLYDLVVNAFDNLFLMLVLYYLRPNHLIFSDEMSVFFRIILYQDRENKYYTIIPFAFQIFILLFYFEMLEFNFCNLNINTAKNIEKRLGNINVENDINFRHSNASDIELGNNYYLKDTDNNLYIDDKDDNVSDLTSEGKDKE